MKEEDRIVTCPYCGMRRGLLDPKVAEGMNFMVCIVGGDDGGLYGCGRTFAVELELVVKETFKVIGWEPVEGRVQEDE